MTSNSSNTNWSMWLLLALDRMDDNIYSLQSIMKSNLNYIAPDCCKHVIKCLALRMYQKMQHSWSWHKRITTNDERTLHISRHLPSKVNRVNNCFIKFFSPPINREIQIWLPIPLPLPQSIFQPANQMCRTSPISQSNWLEIGKR